MELVNDRLNEMIELGSTNRYFSLPDENNKQYNLIDFPKIDGFLNDKMEILLDEREYRLIKRAIDFEKDRDYHFQSETIIREVVDNLSIIINDNQRTAYLNRIKMITSEVLHRHDLATKFSKLKQAKVVSIDTDGVSFNLGRKINDHDRHLLLYFSKVLYRGLKYQRIIAFVDSMLGKDIYVIPSRYLAEGNQKKKKSESSHSVYELTSLINPGYETRINDIIDTLKQTTPPLLNKSNEWLKPVGAAKVFVEILIEKGIINAKVTHQQIYGVFNSNFKTGTSFMRNGQNYKAEGFRDDLSDRIDIAIKDLVS